MTPKTILKIYYCGEYAREAHKRVSALADGMITLSCPGRLRYGMQMIIKSHLVKRPTGDPAFNFATSILGAPCVTIPMLSVGNLPVGIQIVGQREQDYFATQLAKWTYENISSVSVT